VTEAIEPAADKATDGLGRITRRPDYHRVATSGRKWAMPGLILQSYRRADADSADAAEPARLGLTASRKVGGAVERNRARRRLRALAQDVLLPRAKAGTDYVLIGRQATVSRSYVQLRADLIEALRQIERRRRRNQFGDSKERPKGGGKSAGRAVRESAEAVGGS